MTELQWFDDAFKELERKIRESAGRAALKTGETVADRAVLVSRFILVDLKKSFGLGYPDETTRMQKAISLRDSHGDIVIEVFPRVKGGAKVDLWGSLPTDDPRVQRLRASAQRLLPLSLVTKSEAEGVVIKLGTNEELSLVKAGLTELCHEMFGRPTDSSQSSTAVRRRRPAESTPGPTIPPQDGTVVDTAREALAALADAEADLDPQRLFKVRREQDNLRSCLLAGQATGRCVICSTVLPKELLIASHIKPRSRCNSDEKLSPENVALMCSLGCDSLFERGYIEVSAAGEILAGPRAFGTASVEARIASLRGSLCPAHSDVSAVFFAERRRINRERAHNETERF